MQSPLQMTCPLPIREYPRVLLAHGSGGQLMHDLIDRVFVPALQSGAAGPQHDAAVFSVDASRLALTSDSYVVQPLFFPGGDIGSLAVYGTVNDLAMAGARPRYLSAGFILEEGLSMETLWRVVCSMRAAADRAGVRIITGDTKVVDRGKGDGIFINTAGVGVLEHDRQIHPGEVRDGDVVLLSGDVGRHGMAVMAVRSGLSFAGPITSDAAPLNGLVQGLLDHGITVHCLRDVTRGGLATTLNEIARAAALGIEIEEALVPVLPAVRGACEILGFDPLYVACEGRLVAFVPAAEAETALAIMRRDPQGLDAAVIGRVQRAASGQVILKTALGVERVVDMLSGEQLPRIC